MPATAVRASLQAPQPLVAQPGLPSVLSVTAQSTGDGFLPQTIYCIYINIR